MPDYVSGTKTTGFLSIYYDTYVDWAVANEGPDNITGEIHFELRLDGTRVHGWQTTGLDAGYYLHVDDYKISSGTITAGFHTLSIVADYDGRIAETNENDNTWGKSWEWTTIVFAPGAASRAGAAPPASIPQPVRGKLAGSNTLIATASAAAHPLHPSGEPTMIEEAQLPARGRPARIEDAPLPFTGKPVIFDESLASGKMQTMPATDRLATIDVAPLPIKRDSARGATSGVPTLTAGSKATGVHALAAGSAGPEMHALATGSALLIPTAAHSTGALGTNWRTDLEVHNPGSTQASYTIALLKQDTDNGSLPASSVKTFTIDPGLAVRYPDIIDAIFHFSGSAALRITATSGEVLVTSRTYNALGAGNPLNLPAGSTFGQFVPAFAPDAAIASGQQGRLIQLSHRDPNSKLDYRTNVGYVNAGAATIAMVTDLYAANGAHLGAVSDSLRPYELKQINKVFERVTSSTVADGYAIVRTTTAGGAFFAYASVIDNRTGDPVFIPAQRTSDQPEPWVYGTSKTYAAPTAPNGQIHDDITGFVFQFPQGGTGTLKITRTLSGPGIEANQVAFKAEYTGTSQVNLVVDVGSSVFTHLLGYMEGRFVNTLGEFPPSSKGWFAIPVTQTIGTVMTFPLLLPGAVRPAALGVQSSSETPAVSDYTVELTFPPDILDAYKKFASRRDELVSKFLTLYTGAEHDSMRALLTGAHTKADIIVARSVNPSMYKPWIVHPWLTLMSHDIYMGPSGAPALSFDHEFGHYLHHILIGGAFLNMTARSNILGKEHGVGYPNATGQLIEEPAFFNQFFAGYAGSETFPPWVVRIVNGDFVSSALAPDKTNANYPDLEGFTSHMLAQIVRRTEEIRPFLPFAGTDPETGYALSVPVPVVQASGGTNELFRDSYRIIAGITNGTTVYGVRDAIETTLNAKGSQGWKLPPILHAIGWNYPVRFSFVDQNGTKLKGYSARAVINGPAGEHFELPIGHSELTPSSATSTDDGSYVLDWCYPGTSTTLHITETNSDYPTKISIPWTNPANQSVTIPDVVVDQGPCTFTNDGDFRPLVQAYWQATGCPEYWPDGVWLSDSNFINLKDGKVTKDPDSEWNISGTYDCHGNITFQYGFRFVNYPGDCEDGEEVQSTCTVKGTNVPPPAKFEGTCSGTRHVWKKFKKDTCNLENHYDCTFPVSGLIQFHY